MVVSSPEIFLITSIFRYFFPPFLSLFLITRIKREARHLWISFVRNNTSYLYEVSIYQANIPFFSTLKNFHRTNRHVIINYHLERCPPLPPIPWFPPCKSLATLWKIIIERNFYRRPFFHAFIIRKTGFPGNWRFVAKRISIWNSIDTHDTSPVWKDRY